MRHQSAIGEQSPRYLAADDCQPSMQEEVAMPQNRFAGIDWASEEHAVCVVDEHGRIKEGSRYAHDERGISSLCTRLLKLGVTLVAIERPDGLLIERLLDAGLRVIAAHPNQGLTPLLLTGLWCSSTRRGTRAGRG